MSVKREDVLAALARVTGPDGQQLVAPGRQPGVAITGRRVYVSIAVTAADVARWESVRKTAEEAVKALSGVESAVVSLTAEKNSAGDPGATTTVGAGDLPPRKGEGNHASNTSSPSTASFQALAEVGHIIAVASGKGGVGKSTTACNLALALKGLGLSVGILDADIYGPSMPKLFGLRAKPKVIGERTLVPLDGYGVKVMSIGFVVEEAKALIWRGPMVMGAITQMLRDVAWGALDVLVVDMPPGTGDAQLTLAQSAPLAGAVIVSTPQDLALIDARKGVAMFREVGVPILGLVENMSYFVCDGCGKRHEIFAHGGAAKEAARLGVPLLGEIALDPLVRERSDAGLPIVVTEPDSAAAQGYREIARRVWASLPQRALT